LSRGGVLFQYRAVSHPISRPQLSFLHGFYAVCAWLPICDNPLEKLDKNDIRAVVFASSYRFCDSPRTVFDIQSNPGILF
jgi:hypothetical protein